ncbi:hypothetical protein [Methylocella tundrae]|uniref:hypothetical protein n=1 Tax=Methylocella tundrae TaxID=227605 RepID=UPI00106BB700|nr:hypothetical protein [Methylocella tundrae]WPP02772.1 hypothetical protein SIN04_00245 [Methylocella tundrae]
MESSALVRHLARRTTSHDSAVASVVWKAEKLDRIILIRRSDAWMAVVDVPQEIRADLRSFDRDAVGRKGMALTIAVMWALPDMEFLSMEAFGGRPLRDGASPAEFGAIRHFGPGMIGVDIGEFDLANRRRFN